MTAASTLGLYLRTVRNLDPSQVAHRIRLRTQRAVVGRLHAPLERRWTPPTARASWPRGIVAFDVDVDHGSPSPEANAERVFELIGERRHLGAPADWEPADAPQLWRYHLGYFEWAWSFAAHPDRAWARDAFAELWREWRAATVFGRWDAWSPYVASLRAWVLCNVHGTLVANSPAEDRYVRDLALHARYLERNLERDVGGNHLLKNLKALIGLYAFLGEHEKLPRVVGELDAQVDVQVLADGGHFERSPSYHAQVLVDLLDISTVLDALGQPAPRLAGAVEAMRAWLTAMRLPGGGLPMVNDCTPVAPDLLDRLTDQPASDRLVVLAESGYVVARPDDRTHVLVDVGPPCPPTLPAHAHADCLNLLVTVDGTEVLVDTGTSTYAPGARRQLERSTAAHNTVAIDGADQTEVWGTFRAARLARPTVHELHDDGEAIRIVASHDGYSRLDGAPVHRRTVVARPGVIEILDEVTGTGRHRLELALHSPFDALAADRAIALGPVTITDPEVDGEVHPWTVHEADLAAGFGRVTRGTRLQATMDTDLPARLRWRITVGEGEEST